MQRDRALLGGAQPPVEGGIALTVTQVDMIVRLEKVIAMTMIAGGGVVVHRVEDMMIITEIDIMINITMIIIEDLTMTIIMAEIHPGVCLVLQQMRDHLFYFVIYS
jgi:hypothetical protein